ncbi:MAG: pyridoxamine 5'-phosphate oxidase family protein [Tissierellia bacterium]|nr:pyridoxamine 5'-phosphate oxidase family protein [Tissierellia bacterium]
MREMRRKDRSMGREFAIKVIDESVYGTLALVDGGIPYSVPLSIVRIDDRLYFHSAKAGRKVELLASEPQVALSFVGKVEVPDLYSAEELEKIANTPALRTSLIKDVFTTEFDSAMVQGPCHLVTDREEKRRAMEVLCKKYTPDKMKYFDLAMEIGLDYTLVYCVTMEEVSGKQKKKKRELS